MNIIIYIFINKIIMKEILNIYILYINFSSPPKENRDMLLPNCNNRSNRRQINNDLISINHLLLPIFLQFHASDLRLGEYKYLGESPEVPHIYKAIGMMNEFQVTTIGESLKGKYISREYYGLWEFDLGCTAEV